MEIYWGVLGPHGTLSDIFGHEKLAYLEKTNPCHKFHISDDLLV